MNDCYDKDSDCLNWENENDMNFERRAFDTIIIDDELPPKLFSLTYLNNIFHSDIDQHLLLAVNGGNRLMFNAVNATNERTKQWPLPTDIKQNKIS